MDKNKINLDPERVYFSKEVIIAVYKMTGKRLTHSRIVQAARSYGLPKLGRDFAYTKEDIEFIASRVGALGKCPNDKKRIDEYIERVKTRESKVKIK